MKKVLNNALADFIIVGAQKAGTTTLFDMLRNHPEVDLPHIKETQFFLYQLMNPKSAAKFKRRNPDTITNFSDYKNHFAGKGGLISGEASPCYLLDPKIAHSIKSHIPDCKIIIILKEPAKRAWSAYWHYRRMGYEKESDFLTALSLEKITEPIEAGSQERDYIRRGLYSDQVQNYLSLFGPENVKIILFERLIKDPNVLKEIHIFLHISPLSAQTLSHKNSGFNPSRLASFFVRKNSGLRPYIEPLIPTAIRGLVRDGGRLLAQMVSPSVPQITPDQLEVAKSYFREDVETLSHILSDSLLEWDYSGLSDMGKKNA